jgi:hypothetical protein
VECLLIGGPERSKGRKIMKERKIGGDNKKRKKHTRYKRQEEIYKEKVQM